MKRANSIPARPRVQLHISSCLWNTWAESLVHLQLSCSPLAGPSYRLTRSCRSGDGSGEDEVSRNHICSCLADSIAAVVPLTVSVTVKQHRSIIICFKKQMNKKGKKYRTRKLHIKQQRRILWLKASSTQRYKMTWFGFLYNPCAGDYNTSLICRATVISSTLTHHILHRQL